MGVNPKLFLMLGALAFAGLFVNVSYDLYEGTHYNIHIKATLVDVDKISGGYRCTVRTEVTNQNDYAIYDIHLNITILTEDGEKYYSKEEALSVLNSGAMWSKTFKIDIIEDPGDTVTITVIGDCIVEGKLQRINPEPIVADVPG